MKKTTTSYEMRYYSKLMGQFCTYYVKSDELTDFKLDFEKLSDKMQKEFHYSVFEFIRAILEYNS